MDRMQIQFTGGNIGMIINDDGPFIRYIDVNRQVYIVPFNKVITRISFGKSYYVYIGNDQDKIADTINLSEDIFAHDELVNLTHH